MLRSTVPSQIQTGGISPRFGGGLLYTTGILKRPGNLLRNILRTDSAAGTTPMKIVVSREQVDQPFLAAVERDGKDRVYVGSNDFMRRLAGVRRQSTRASTAGRRHPPSAPCA